MACTWGCNYSLCKRGGEQSIHSGIPAQSNYFHSVDKVHAQTALPKQAMISLEYHVVTSQ